MGKTYTSPISMAARLSASPPIPANVFPVFSPDGSRIATIRRNRGLMTVGGVNTAARNVF